MRKVSEKMDREEVKKECEGRICERLNEFRLTARKGTGVIICLA